MQLRSARILLVIFTLSVSLIQLIELGHSILHRFKNPIHYHKISKVKDFKDHSIAEHHFPKMKFAHEMDEPTTPNNFIALAYGYFQALTDYQFSCSQIIKRYYTEVIKRNYIVYFSPPTPPPLLIRLS